MVAVKDVVGSWIKSRRRSLGIYERKAFARQAGISETLLWQIETGEGLPFHERREVVRNAIAANLKVDVKALEAFSRGESGEPSTVIPSGLRPGSDRPLTDRDHFHGVAAARIDRREPVTRDNVKAPAGGAREFAVTIDGDCMSPKYEDGDVVLFSIDAVERGSGVIYGRSYFLQFNDGESTFKRVFDDPESLENYVLKTWNPKYPSRTVDRSSVILTALATGKISHPE